MSISWGALAGVFLAQFMYGLFSKKITKAAVWTSFITGVGITVIIEEYIKANSEVTEPEYNWFVADDVLEMSNETIFCWINKIATLYEQENSLVRIYFVNEEKMNLAKENYEKFAYLQEEERIRNERHAEEKRKRYAESFSSDIGFPSRFIGVRVLPELRETDRLKELTEKVKELYHIYSDNRTDDESLYRFIQ